MLSVAGGRPPSPVALIQRTEGHFEGARGGNLFERAWLPDAPRAALLLIHGFAEHSGRYEHVGAWFAAKGLAAHAFDHQGHGLSSGPRCYVRRFSDLLDDAEISIERVRRKHSGLPIFVIGHSMGGLVTAALACQRKPAVAGFVTSGAALRAPASLSRTRRVLLRVLRHIAPKLSFPAGLDPEGLSCDPAVVRAYLDDPLVERRISVSLAAELFAAMRQTLGSASAVELPLLVLHGADDPICPSLGSEQFAAAAASGRYLAFPGMRHEIFNEPGREAVFDVILGWMLDVLRGARA